MATHRVHSGATLAEVAETICRRSIGAVGVNDDNGKVLGIITERDLAWAAAQGHHPAAVAAGEVVNDFPLVADAPISREAARKLMLSAHVRHIVVRTGDDYGIVSIRDVLRENRLPAPSRDEQTHWTAGDIMTSPCVSCREDNHIEELAELLAARGVSGIPVVDSQGNVTGLSRNETSPIALGVPRSGWPYGARRCRGVMGTTGAIPAGCKGRAI